MRCVIQFDCMKKSWEGERVGTRLSLWQTYGRCEVDSSLILLLEANVWRSLVQSDSEPFQFSLNESLVLQGL